MLLLNKYDILEAKLNSGVLFRKFVTSYKDKPNDIQNVLSCMFSLFRSAILHSTVHVLISLCLDLKGKFAMIYKQNRQSGGMLHIHVTCATVSTCLSCSGTATNTEPVIVTSYRMQMPRPLFWDEVSPPLNL